MDTKRTRQLALAFFALVGFSVLINGGQTQKSGSAFSPMIPKTWDDEAIANLEVPLAEPDASPVHVSSTYYYRMRVRPIYKTYPIYPIGKEPPGYWEWLNQQEPQDVFDAAKLKTKDDWVKAGELVYQAPIAFDGTASTSEVRDPAWWAKVGAPVAKDGTLPFYRYVIRARGKVEVGDLSCWNCHNRLMPDGTVIQGAQGNSINELTDAYKKRTRDPVEKARRAERVLFAAPWLRPDPQARLAQMTVEEIAGIHEAIPPGVNARRGTSSSFPVQIPDLIGVKDRRYLDHTGLEQHRSIGDLMRYDALNQGAEFLARYGDFTPITVLSGKVPEPETQQRYSDEQLYALALYIYSLKPPPNPNKFDGLAERGQRVFQGEGCAGCHTPPLYTNNKLTPAEGFKVPEEHLKKYDILPMSVGTDPSLALRTRRGTGYYKVPSLKGVWYRGPFEHMGSVATLEDWFDPRRLRDDYVPTGFRGVGVKTRAVKGHPFGLNLSVEDRKALIAFLKTL